MESERLHRLSEQIRTVPSLRLLGVSPDQPHADSGSGTTIYKVGLIPKALKVFDLPSSEKLTLADVEGYQHTTDHFRRKIANYRRDLITREYLGFKYTWRVNPITSVGLVNLGNDQTVPFSLSPWINGISLGDLFSHPERLASLHLPNNPEMTGFLHQELTRFRELLQFNYPYSSSIKLIALNVLLERQGRNNYGLVITNIREFVNRRQNRLYKA